MDKAVVIERAWEEDVFNVSKSEEIKGRLIYIYVLHLRSCIQQLSRYVNIILTDFDGRKFHLESCKALWLRIIQKASLSSF